MAVEFKIRGNFFSIKDIPTSIVYLNETIDSVKFYRDNLDVFSFFPKGIGVNSISYQNLTVAGTQRNKFPFADIVDERTGLPFGSADVLDDYLSDNLGFLNPATEYVKTVTGTAVDNSDPLNPVINNLESSLLNRVSVNQSNFLTTICGVIDSSKEYFLDGIIDIGSNQITIPQSGMTIKGYSFDISGLTSSENNYTMFVSETPGIGSGNILGIDYFVTVNGVNSKVYDVYDYTGFNAFEFSRINYIDCTSLGDIHDYRQGLESGTGRFGGSPSLTLHGTWLGGYRITTSIVRMMSDTTTEPLFKAGTGFVMNSRFLTDMNVDLGTLQPLIDFSDVNFPNPSTLELRGCIVTRDGLTVPTDTNITPNIDASNLSCSWKDNNGIPNTFVGAIATITTEIQTIVSGGLPSPILGTVILSDVQHFDSPANGQLRNLGNNPRDYTVNFDFILDGGADDEYKIELVKNDGADTVIYQQIRVINNLQRGRDVAYFTGLANVILNKNEYIFWQVTNLTSNTNCTLELDSAWSVEER